MQEFVLSVPDRQAIHRRFVAFGPVLLLHAALLIALLHMNWSAFNRIGAPEHEITLLLNPTPVVPVWQGDLLPPPGGAAGALPRLAAPAIRTQETFGAGSLAADNSGALTSELQAVELQAVSRMLFKCWTGGPAGLTPVKDAQCLSFAPDHSFDFSEAPERSHNAEEWLRDRDRKNAPFSMPCWSGLSLATVSCVANGLANGFDLENQPSYADYDHQDHMNGADSVRREMQTIDPCAIDRSAGPGLVCLDRVVNGGGPP
jgi:hypothetical protein